MKSKELRPLSPAQMRRRTALAAVDTVVMQVNSVLADPERRKAAMGQAVGEVYHVIANVRLTPEQAHELEERFRAAHWPAGQVVVWEQRTAVVLHARSNSGWSSAYDGKPLDKVLAKTIAKAA